MVIRNEQPWQLLLLMGSGVFIGSFWVLFGFLSVVGTPAAWWQYLISLLPGTAMLFLVLMARRAPIPYGSAMVLMGGLLTITSLFRGEPLMSGAVIGIPLGLLGIFFVLTRRVILSGNQKNR
ncbi:hypothetical protein K8S19_00680 [bacterium]|nr:hypothetical protein [bacterium]